MGVECLTSLTLLGCAFKIYGPDPLDPKRTILHMYLVADPMVAVVRQANILPSTQRTDAIEKVEKTGRATVEHHGTSHFVLFRGPLSQRLFHI